jgi:Putative transposase of IS4/5 family (DUF4096)
MEEGYRQGVMGQPRADDWRFFTAILYVLITGCRWNDLPKEYGHDSIGNYFLNLATASATVAALRPLTMTVACSRARERAISKPIPPVEAVTRAR